jgi:hypothetical protein
MQDHGGWICGNCTFDLDLMSLPTVQNLVLGASNGTKWVHFDQFLTQDQFRAKLAQYEAEGFKPWNMTITQSDDPRVSGIVPRSLMYKLKNF